MTRRSVSDSIVPIWLDRLAQWSWRILIGLGFLVVAVLLAVQVPLVLIPVTLAIILAATFAPVYRRLLARGWTPTNAAATVTVATIAITTVVVILTVASLATQMEPVVQAAMAGAQQLVGSSSDTLSLAPAGRRVVERRPARGRPAPSSPGRSGWPSS